MNPYAILGISEDAEDQAVRKAYLTLVKRYPPERDEKRFQLINKAFEKIKTEQNRSRYNLFNQEIEGETPITSLLYPSQMPHMRKPLPFEKMKEFLQQCSTL